VSALDFSALTAYPEFPRLSELLTRISLAALLGGAIAFRFWRVLMPFVPRPSASQAQAQTLIAAAAAVMVVVIGDSPARAFGLVGLGSFIRFRTGLSDPRDAAVLFVMIGVGMSAGLGLHAMAIGATIFVSLLLMWFDASRGRRVVETRVTIQAADAAHVELRLRELFRDARFLESAGNAPELGKDTGKLVVNLALKRDTDASALAELLRLGGIEGIRRVVLTREEQA
jgi:hypothetical protein